MNAGEKISLYLVVILVFFLIAAFIDSTFGVGSPSIPDGFYEEDFAGDIY